jgi:hypothetical protein
VAGPSSARAPRARARAASFSTWRWTSGRGARPSKRYPHPRGLPAPGKRRDGPPLRHPTRAHGVLPRLGARRRGRHDSRRPPVGSRKPTRSWRSVRAIRGLEPAAPADGQWRGTTIAHGAFRNSRLLHFWADGTEFQLARCRRSNTEHFELCLGVLEGPLGNTLEHARLEFPQDWAQPAHK